MCEFYSVDVLLVRSQKIITAICASGALIPFYDSNDSEDLY